MKLLYLVKKYDWEDIRSRFFKLYPDQKKNEKGYKELLDKVLPIIKPNKSNFRIVVHREKDDVDKRSYVCVSGGNEAECETSYLAIEFTPWQVWLNSYIDIRSTVEFTEIDILCHCLWEMSWAGWSQKEIKRRLDEIHKSAKEIKKSLNGSNSLKKEIKK